MAVAYRHLRLRAASPETALQRWAGPGMPGVFVLPPLAVQATAQLESAAQLQAAWAMPEVFVLRPLAVRAASSLGSALAQAAWAMPMAIA